MTIALNYQFRIKSKGLSSHMANIIEGYYCLFVYLINYIYSTIAKKCTILFC